jgi:hypothetical protein
MRAGDVGHIALLLGLLASAVAASERGPWRRPIVVVVTWHSAASIEWLAALPASRVQVALYAKGDARSCAAVPTSVRPLLAFCTRVPNAGGREAHTAALFLARFYHALPRVTVFAQDDCTVLSIRSAADPRLGGASNQCGVLRLALWDAAATRAWVAAREAAPGDAFATEASCLCELVHEPGFRRCAPGTPAGACYGEGYLPMSWLLRTFLGHAPAEWDDIRWAARAQLAVPRALIRSRPRELYVLLRELLAADAADGRDRRAEEAPTLLYVQSAAGVHNKRLTSLNWAHSLERLWFAVFDVRYSPYKHGNASR